MGQTVQTAAVGDDRTIACHDSIHDLPPDEWDRLAAGNLYLSHTWLSVVEADDTCTTPPTS